MIPLLAARRRADEFDALVQGKERADAHPELVALAAVADELVSASSVPTPEMSKSAGADLRSRLMAEADEVLLPLPRGAKLGAAAGNGRAPGARRDRRIAIAASALVAIGATTSAAVASQDAVPGDTLYPIKRLVEDVRTTLHFDDTARGESQLEIAGGRLDELSELARAKGTDSNLERALIDFRADTNKAAKTLIGRHEETGEQAPLVTLDEFSASSLERLGTISAALPSNVLDELGRTTLLLRDLDTAVSDLCPDCAAVPLTVPQELLDVLGAQLTDGASPTRDSADVADDPVAPAPELVLRKPDSGKGSGGQDPAPTRDFELPDSPGDQPGTPDTPAAPDVPNPPSGGDNGDADDPVEDLKDPVKKLKDTVKEDIPVVSPLTRDLLGGLFGRSN